MAHHSTHLVGARQAAYGPRTRANRDSPGAPGIAVRTVHTHHWVWRDGTGRTSPVPGLLSLVCGSGDSRVTQNGTLMCSCESLPWRSFWFASDCRWERRSKLGGLGSQASPCSVANASFVCKQNWRQASPCVVPMHVAHLSCLCWQVKLNNHFFFYSNSLLAMLYYTMLYYTMLYYTIPYYTILYYTILYYTML